MNNHLLERTNNIKTLLEDRKIEPFIDLDNIQTEYQVNKLKNCGDDIRQLINKNKISFSDFMKDFGGNIEYINSGSSGHTFKGKVVKNGKEFQYGIKVVAYRKNKKISMYEKERPENVELLMIKTLSQLVLSNQTPYIALPLYTFDTKIDGFIDLYVNDVKNNKDEYIIPKTSRLYSDDTNQKIKKKRSKYSKFVEQYNEKDVYDRNVSILISEWANRGDFLSFLKERYLGISLEQWQVFFFQLISCLAVIHTKYPGFRHNDLKANNILIHKVNCIKVNQIYKVKNNEYKSIYGVNEHNILGQKFIIPNIGYILQLWDYDFSCIPGLIENNKVNAKWTDDINIFSERHQYYDLHYFFNMLINNPSFVPEIMTDTEYVPQEVKDFILRILPKELHSGSSKVVKDKWRLLDKHEYTTPLNIIFFDPFFERFRDFNNKNLDINKLLNNKNIINTHNIKINIDNNNRSDDDIKITNKKVIKKKSKSVFKKSYNDGTDNNIIISDILNTINRSK